MMAALVYYEADSIWPLFMREKDKLRTSMKTIAENTDFSVAVFLTEEDRGTESYPSIIVYVDGDEVYEELAVSEKDCKQTVRKIYYEYLTEERIVNRLLEQDEAKYGDKYTGGNADEGDPDEEDTDDEGIEEDMIERREDALDGAVQDFFLTVLDEPLEDIVGDKSAAEFYDDFKEHALEYIARKYELGIYRPMILEDDNGEEFFEEYPYDVMEYDDPDNPLYR